MLDELSNLIIFAVICIIATLLFLFSTKLFFTQINMRRHLKKVLQRNRAEIRQAKGNKAQRFEVYKRVYNNAIYSGRRFRGARRQRKYEQRMNAELNLMFRNPVTALFSWLKSVVFGLATIFLLLCSLVFGTIAVDEFKASSLTLPTVNPQIALKLDNDFNFDFDNGLKQLFNMLTVGGPSRSNFNVEKVATADITPVYKEKDYPNDVTNAEQLGQAIAHYMGQFENNFTIQYYGTAPDLQQVVDDAMLWLEGHEPYLSRLRRELTWRAKDYRNGHIEFQIEATYDMTAEQNALVKGMVKQIVSAMPSNLSDVDKVKYVNDYIVTNTQYNLDSKVSPYTPYSILANGEGVCEGYALTALLLLDELNIETKYISGEVISGELHAWNLVKLDGEWYHLDTTWNDPVPDQGNKVFYNYFLISDEQISKDHIWDTSKYPATAGQGYM
ncbi:transglutaminase domain-containing protein [Bacillus ndiopicus]|uniref:transglutaminase domain-containing protein n=1 Tax=Bacillus ndiopicus TaxID=1347368 RepID=UPI0005A96843|nr:transglutaminase domain-containing protein [Bacillus ndiopicus]